jgi:hypothetical protein
MFRFSAVPTWSLEAKKGLPVAEPLTPDVPSPSVAALAVEHIEFRGAKLADAIDAALEGQERAVIFARSPNDLPALLRTADQLRSLSLQATEGLPQVFHCACGAAYNVPHSLFHPLTIRCDRCSRLVELNSTRLSDSPVSNVSLCRDALAAFFREAMARGWVVLVDRAPADARG